MTVSAGFQLANLIAELIGARNPQWEEQEEYTGAPAAADEGIALQDAIVSLITVGLRGEVHRRKALLTVTTFDAAATYTLTINGTALTDITPTNVDDLLIGLRNTITANAVVGGAAAIPIISARCLSAAGAITTGTVAGGAAAVTLEILGAVEADYSIDIAATGTGELACVADAKSATVRFFLYTNTTNLRSSATTAPEYWALVPGSEQVLDYRGLSGEGRTNGAARLFVEVDDVAGAGDGADVTHRIGGGVHVGPCVRETS